MQASGIYHWTENWSDKYPVLAENTDLANKMDTLTDIKSLLEGEWRIYCIPATKVPTRPRPSRGIDDLTVSRVVLPAGRGRPFWLQLRHCHLGLFRGRQNLQGTASPGPGTAFQR